MKKVILFLFIFFSPFIVGGATDDGVSFKEIAYNLYNGLFMKIIDFLFILSILFFAFSVFRFIFVQEAEDKSKMKDILLWSIIAFFVMFSFWGILNILNSTLFLEPLSDGNYDFDVDYQKYIPR